MSGTNENDLVFVSRESMTELFGKWGLPPWPSDDPNVFFGVNVNCAVIAQEIAADIDDLIAHGSSILRNLTKEKI